MSKICYNGACFVANGKIKNLNLKYPVNINDSIIVNCNLLKRCDNRLVYYTKECLPWWLVSLASFLLFLLFIFIVGLPLTVIIIFIKRFKISSEEIKNRSNSRVKYSRRKAIIVQNSRAPNRTKTKVSRSFSCFCLFFLFTIADCCDSMFDYSSSVKICEEDGSCNFKWVSEVSFSSLGQSICFYGDRKSLMKLTLNRMYQSCESRVEYYTPLYDADLSTYTRCSGTSECSDGKFYSNSTHIHIDVPRQNNGRDWCLSPYDECLRITLNIKSRDNYCTSMRCLKINYKFKIKIESDLNSIIELTEGSSVTDMNGQFKLLNNMENIIHL